MQRAHLFGRAFRRGHGGGSAECTQEERRPLMARTNGREQKAGQHADAKAKGSLHADLLNDLDKHQDLRCYVAGVVMIFVIIKGVHVASCYKICKLRTRLDCKFF
jgi:hypothetical protein